MLDILIRNAEIVDGTKKERYKGDIVIEDDAADFIIEHFMHSNLKTEDLYEKLDDDFEHGLKLVREKTEQNRFYISKEALVSPETYIKKLLQEKPMIEEGAGQTETTAKPDVNT